MRPVCGVQALGKIESEGRATVAERPYSAGTEDGLTHPNQRIVPFAADDEIVVPWQRGMADEMGLYVQSPKRRVHQGGVVVLGHSQNDDIASAVFSALHEAARKFDAHDPRCGSRRVTMVCFAECGAGRGSAGAFLGSIVDVAVVARHVPALGVAAAVFLLAEIAAGYAVDLFGRQFLLRAESFFMIASWKDRPPTVSGTIETVLDCISKCHCVYLGQGVSRAGGEASRVAPKPSVPLNSEGASLKLMPRAPNLASMVCSPHSSTQPQNRLLPFRVSAKSDPGGRRLAAGRSLDDGNREACAQLTRTRIGASGVSTAACG